MAIWLLRVAVVETLKAFTHSSLGTVYLVRTIGTLNLRYSVFCGVGSDSRPRAAAPDQSGEWRMENRDWNFRLAHYSTGHRGEVSALS